MSIFDTLTVEDFKLQFPRWTPVYLPNYTENNTYFQDDIVYYDGLFYQCVVANTTSNPTNTDDWTLYNTSVLNYTQDSDIENAIAEAKVNFNEKLFGNDDKARLVFLYLVAYYLTMDFQNASGAGGIGIVTSRSVGSVSESRALPAWMTSNSILSVYAQNPYGVKYLSLIRPYLIGNILFFKGATTHE